MIVEVNNTFDERRMYFVRNQSEHMTTDTTKSFGRWAKDFHVSPFNSRKGSYEMKALDPWTQPGKGSRFRNVINLNSSKSHLKLVASVTATQDAIDPSSYTKLDTWLFLASWWWVGLVTFPRIVKEAAKLFFWKKLHVWFRPEVLRSTIGRQASTDETQVTLCSSQPI